MRQKTKNTERTKPGRASSACSIRDGTGLADRHAAGDFEVRKHRQIGEHPLGDHAHIGADIRPRDQHENLPAVHQIPDDPRHVRAELLDRRRLDVELDHLAFDVAPERLMQRDFPALSEAEDSSSTPS